jgi:hypothetical protein
MLASDRFSAQERALPCRPCWRLSARNCALAALRI